jgi:hypothetical protein
VRAVLAISVTVCGEGFAAAGTGEVIYSLPVDAVQVAVPPCSAAGIGAEPSGLSFGNELNGLATVFAQHGILWCVAIQSVPAAEGPYRVIGNAQGLADFHIAQALQAHNLDLFHLIVRHKEPPI